MDEVFMIDEAPPNHGWYVTVTLEGGTPGVNFWNGEEFITNEAIESFHNHTFVTSIDAIAWLYDHYDEVCWR